MRELIRVAYAALVLATALSAEAGVFNQSPDTSAMSLQIGRTKAVVIPNRPHWPLQVSLTAPLPSIVVQDQVFDLWSTLTVFGTSLFTGVPLLEGFWQYLDNDAVTFAPAPGTAPHFIGTGAYAIGEFTGLGGVNGYVSILDQSWNGDHYDTLPLASFDLRKAGMVGIDHAVNESAGLDWIVSFDRWGTGEYRITGITTTVVQLPDRSPPVTGVGLTLEPTRNEAVRIRTTQGGFVSQNPNGLISFQQTVVLAGSNELGSLLDGTGNVSLVTPLRIDTRDFGRRIPGFIRMELNFVPEPSRALLLLAGAAGLLLLGNRSGKH